MGWNVGKLINQNLQENIRAEYGQKLFAQLEQDVTIKKRTLYKIHNFYKTYPQLPKDDERLNWTHYCALAEIKNSDKRQYLENLVVENNWSTDELVVEVKKTKNSTSKQESGAGKNVSSKIKSLDPHMREDDKKAKLTAIRGQLFTYPLVTLNGSDQTYIDCGFNIFKTTNTKIKTEKTVVSAKKGEEYSFKETKIDGKKLNIYKA